MFKDFRSYIIANEIRHRFCNFVIAVYSLFYKRWKAQGKEIVFIRTTMYVYLAFVLYFTLMPIATSLQIIFNHTYVPMNMVPFIDVLDGRGDFLKQIGLNVIMTIPFGNL